MKKRRLSLFGGLSIVFVLLLIAPNAAPRAAVDDNEVFSALAFLKNGAGPRMVAPGATANLKIYVNAYTSDESAKQFAAALFEKGPNDLLKMLEKAKDIGRVSLDGRVGFFELKLIRTRPTETGRRLVGVCDRPIGFLEMYESGRSIDNKFGIVILDLKRDEKGKETGVGQLIYAAKIKVLEGNHIEIESYGVAPVPLQGVVKL